MTVKTGGPIRGFLGRWLMRLEAAGQILNMAFLGVTAASTFTTALALIGYQHLAPYVLGGGVVVACVFAYVYVEWGIYNRKNRENKVRGNDFSKPQNAIDNAILARSILAGELERELSDDEREVINQEAFAGYLDFKDGVPIDE